jgi:hypothetical protein
MTIKIHIGSKEGGQTLELQEGQEFGFTPTGDASRVPNWMNRQESNLVAGPEGMGGKLIHKCWESGQFVANGYLGGSAHKIEREIKKGQMIQLNETVVAEGTD